MVRISRQRNLEFILLLVLIALIYLWLSGKDTSALPFLYLSSSTRTLLSPQNAYWEQDGLLYLADEARPGANPQNKVDHPILQLIQKAKSDWRKKLESQSKDLRSALVTYKHKYGRPPPKDFDKWYHFAKENNVVLLDNYDQLNRDILPFLGLPSQPLLERSRLMIEDPHNYYYQGSFTLWIQDGRVVKITGGMKDHTRVKEQTGLLQRFVHMLPDMNITVWAHDTSVVHLTGEKRLELENLAKQGKTLPHDRWEDWADPPEFVGWEAFCKPNSNMRNAIGGIEPRPAPPDPSFISKHFDSSDFCRHPENIPLHSLTGNYGVGPRAVNLWPVFAQSKLSLYADLLVTPLEQWEVPVGLDPDWALKTRNFILWRGSSTGSRYDRGVIWRAAQRVRLALLTNSNSKDVHKTVYTTSASDNRTLEAYRASLGVLNSRYFDVLFTGHPIQCDVDDGTCDAVGRHVPFTEEHMRQDMANHYKYVLDVDGNGWSGRFHRLMSSKAAVLKSTGFTEWWGDRVQPWVHYIPVKLDYTDLHSIASFFVGDEYSPGHDKLGSEIGLAGKEWAETHWRMQDMEAYMFRLYLEYARLMHRDPGNPKSMDFRA